MIKPFKYVHIHFLTVLLFFICFCVGKGRVFLFTYSIMLLHELSHTIAALCIGLKVDNISLYPFGVNLKLKNKFVHSFSDELILYICGPLFNIVFAFVMLMLYTHFRIYEFKYLYYMNVMLFAMNMLPVMPLDGGVLLKKIIAYYCNTARADKIMRGVSAILCFLMCCTCGYCVYVAKFNFSMVIMCVFLVGSIFCASEKYDVDFVKELVFSYKDKNMRRIRHTIADKREEMQNIVKKFSKNSYNVVYLTDDTGKICNVLTEKEIINKMLE